ncbi:MAG: hypothetical protein FD139_3289 [Methylocystaceae bacterium]|jgi:uncharacterized BrkB/YihY/UPF0761 family membrane protein|nr:MAG: hypothetical protein FD148_2270 [Methylocystaceae bacterium]KAF0213868.1 MAG: hypothetical protein FD172_295 [Methylocystaceae bacterium]TXT42909.1 MAG: hypothetical protein FD139_3289 [Methylocystaceae bacterium]
MWSRETWLFVILTWIALIIGGIIVAVIESRHRNQK